MLSWLSRSRSEDEEEEDEEEYEETSPITSPMADASQRLELLRPVSDTPTSSADATPLKNLQEVNGDDIEGVEPGKAVHHCTDIVCVLILAAALGALGFIFNYAQHHGNVHRLFHGLDFEGKLCGIDVPEKFLYWCRSGGGVLDLGHPICVASCPASNLTFSQCFSEAPAKARDAVRDYPTYSLAGRLCMPVDSWLEAQVSKSPFGPLAHDFLELTQVVRAWQPLLISAGLALLLGYMYLFFLNCAVGQILWVCMTLLIIICMAGGGYLTTMSFHGGLDRRGGTGDGHWDFVIGLSTMALGVVFLLIACCRKKSIDMAIGCIEAACECIFSLPSLLLEPLFTLTLKAITLGPMSAGFLWLLSCGKVVNHKLYRTLEYSQEEQAFIVYYIFMMIWVNELWSGLSYFAISYVTQWWYFTPYTKNSCVGRSKWGLPSYAIVRGFAVGLFLHLGTLAFGSVLIAFVRVIRLALAWLEKAASDTGNCCGACIAKVLFCCMYCFERCLQFISSNAYMDVALHSSNFCTAAHRSTAIMSNEVSAMGALMGACWMFQLGGLGAITGLGALLTGVLVRHVDAYSNPASELYVEDPLFLTVVSAAICFLVALTFMIGFDTVSCTILYCFASEKHQARTITGQAKTVIDARGKPATSHLQMLASGDGDDIEGSRRNCTPTTLQHLLRQEAYQE